MARTSRTDRPAADRIASALTAAALVAVTFVVAGPSGGAAAAPGSTDPQTAQDLARVRRATQAFHSIEAAEAAGYVGFDAPCVGIPGVGAMGVHVVNFEAIGQPGFDLERPEVLIYFPSGNGLRLVAVEYLTVDADQNLATDGDRPVAFGTGFDGPMEGHEPGMPIHYDLHVWAWQANPAGVTAQWNPSLTCPTA